MTDPAAAPRSLEEALAQGYRPVEDPEPYLADQARDKGLMAHRVVDCQVDPPGTICFEKTYPDGTVVGYCDGNGICKLYKKP